LQNKNPQEVKELYAQIDPYFHNRLFFQLGQAPPSGESVGHLQRSLRIWVQFTPWNKEFAKQL